MRFAYHIKLVVAGVGFICAVLLFSYQWLKRSDRDDNRPKENNLLFESNYPLSQKSYQHLYAMTKGAIRQRSIIDTVNFFLYDVAQPVSEIDNNAKCILLINADPQYTVCVENKSYFHDILQRDFVWEPTVQRFIKEFFNEHPDAMFVDLGINIGLHSLYATTVNYNVQVLGIDPYLRSIAALHKSVHRNKLQDRFTVVLGAISDKRKIIAVGGEDSAGFRITFNDINQTEFQVPSLTLNDLTALVKVKKVLLKMDIEGSECLVFANADKFFAEIDVPAIIMEFRHTKLKGACCFEAMLQFLADRNYKAFYFKGDMPNHPEPLNFSMWNKWDERFDIYFKKFYIL